MLDISSRAAIFSDIHIGVHRDGAIWHDITIEWCEWFKSVLEENNIDSIIFCGDFFHYRDSVNILSLNIGYRVLDMLRDYKIIMIPGNHCSFYKDHSTINSISIFNNYPNITVIESPTSFTTPTNKKISFIPWGTTLKRIPKSDIIFGHFEIETFKLNSYKICDHGMPVDSIFKKSPLTISGHFHLRSERRCEDGTILYVGNPFQMDFGDAGGTKGVYIIDLDTSKYEFIENILSPTFHKITLSGLVDASVDITSLSARVKNNIIKFIIDKKISTSDAEFLFKQFRALAPRALEVEHDINFNVLIQSEEGRDFSGVDIESAITEFINIMEIDNKRPVIDYVLDLYKRAARL
jgi:DNA repair exonuclease SbcCD nuclease subunit